MSLPKDHPIILMYHSIPMHHSKLREHDVFDLRVSSENFAVQMEIVSQERTVLPLEEFIELFAARKLPADATTITFDDGYLDNLSIAKPILERDGIPATVFLTTGTLGTSEFWWDRLERIICEAGSLPEKVNLELHNDPITVALNGSNADTLRSIHGHLRDLEPAARDAAIDGLAETLRVAHCSNRPRPLTEDEVRKLATGTISIGAHTVSHPWLPRLTLNELTHELTESKRHCQGLIGGSVSSFAYPFGAYDGNARAAVIAAGFKLACATLDLPVLSDCDRFALPRIHAKDWSADDFERRICPSSRA